MVDLGEGVCCDAGAIVDSVICRAWGIDVVR